MFLFTLSFLSMNLPTEASKNNNGKGNTKTTEEQYFEVSGTKTLPPGKAKKHVIEEPVTEEPTTEEPVTEEPVTEEPVIVEPSPDETVPPSDEVTSPMVLGFYTKYWQTDLGSYHSLTEFHPYLNTIATATFDFERDGTITGFMPTEALDFSKQQSVITYATVQNKFDPITASQILQDPALRQKAIANMLKLVQDNGYDGVNINLENMYATDRPYFNQFLSEAVSVFHSNDLPVMVSVPAKTCDCPSWAWSGTFDFDFIGKSNVDYVQIMSYDQHGSWGQPGPVAGLNWVQTVLNYATSHIPSEKLLIGIPAYGYDWNTTKGTGHRALTLKQIQALINERQPMIQWDSTSQSPYFHYVDEYGDSHVVWFENNTSIALKTELVHSYNLAGVSMWRMGQETRDFWESIDSVLSR